MREGKEDTREMNAKSRESIHGGYEGCKKGIVESVRGDQNRTHTHKVEGIYLIKRIMYT